MSECKVDKYSSRVCELGTKCCTVNHKNKDDALIDKLWERQEWITPEHNPICDEAIKHAFYMGAKAVRQNDCEGVIGAMLQEPGLPHTVIVNAIRNYYGVSDE